VRILLLLDGADDEAAAAARAQAVTTIVKDPPGPTKGAALRWLVETRADLLDEADAVLVLDVGSRLTPGFFDSLRWPENAQAVQAWLLGEGAGVGHAASLSESAAQRWQDRGRQSLGWAVQLRGTGTAFKPSTLRLLAPRLKTSVEDTESTLLLAADGGRIVLGGEGAIVEDIKPVRVADAARQRSRWLLGQLAVLVRQPGALLRLAWRNPLEGIAFIAGLLSRPLSLTALLRLLLALGFAVDGLAGRGGAPSLAASGVLVVSLFSDLVLLRRATDAPWPHLVVAGLRILLAWGGALLMLPRAFFGWARGRRG
jgi:cellulose synthase/poly-beta-1,6-N-acetylglucosamine synthase-like glycosyltransferase